MISLGAQVVDWVESHLCHGPGDVLGDPIELDAEFVAFVRECYRLDDAGRRVFRRAILSRAKGRAKSELAAMIVCAEALGPVRFDRWAEGGERSSWGYEYDVGEPIGAPVRSPLIRCLATEEGQTGHVYGAAAAMLTHARDAHGLLADVGLTRTFLPGGGVILPSTASSASKDGGRETFGVADEIHLYVLAELHRMHATVRRNLGKRRAAEPWLLETTTAFLPGEQSVAEQAHEWVREVGQARAVAAGVLYDHVQAPPIADWDDDAEILAGLRVAYGPFSDVIDLERVLAEIRDPHAERADSFRYWMNTPTAGSNQWLAPAAWDARAQPVPVADGELVALGFDGSKFDDSTALIGCRLGATPEEPGHLFVLGLWEKPDGIAGHGWEVPRAEVDAAVHDAFSRYNVARFYADPPYWQDEVDAWHQEFGDAVAPWWTHRDAQMARALERLHTAVLDGTVTHDGDRRLAAHIANARKRKTRAGVTIAKDSKRSARKIDAAIAAALAFEARADAIRAGAAQPKPAYGAYFF